MFFNRTYMMGKLKISDKVKEVSSIKKVTVIDSVNYSKPGSIQISEESVYDIERIGTRKLYKLL